MKLEEFMKTLTPEDNKNILNQINNSWEWLEILKYMPIKIESLCREAWLWRHTLINILEWYRGMWRKTNKHLIIQILINMKKLDKLIDYLLKNNDKN